MTPVQSTQFRLPLLNIEFELSAQKKKVMAVALASLALFVLQLGLSLSLALGLSALITLLTHLKPRPDNDWFNTQFDHKKIGFLATFLILRPFIIQIFFWALGIPLPPIAQEGIAKMILSEPWKMVALASVVAPFSEEILFRGFLLERLEDLHLSARASDIAQSLIFGVVHLNKAIESGMEILVMLMLSFMGHLFARFKQEENTLIAPMAIHSANNLGACIYVHLRSGK